MKYVVSIGSNECQRENMPLARRRLTELFADIRFSHEEETIPIRLHRSCMFANQVACFNSDLLPEEVRARLKDIEREAGRSPEDKLREIVKLDIDLLMCGDCVLKPEDWEREYVQEGLNYLKMHSL